MHEPKDSHRVIRKKNKYRTVTHTCGIQKNGTDEPIYKAEMETQIENKFLGSKGEAGMNQETETAICTLLIPCMKQIANKKLLNSTGTSTQGSVVT